ncbi:MAG: hypothetical protein EOO22_03155 [Comamonadaceae bacterium]|nr:MAG: hypothetical protein EOO22_03155 [Comamonadaceae bacterium]
MSDIEHQTTDQIHAAGGLNQDKTQAVVIVPGEPPVRLNFNAAQADQFLHGLADLRAQMLPSHPMKADLSQEMVAISNPKWLIHPHAATESVLVHVRHPGFGWLLFALPPATSRRLGEALIKVADAVEAKPAQTH